MEALKKEWLEEMKAQMGNNERDMEDMAKTYEEKLKEAKQRAADGDKDLEKNHASQENHSTHFQHEF